MQTISFTEQDGVWTSDPIRLSGGDIAVRVEMSRSGRVEVQRSVTGDNFVVDGSFGSNGSGIAETNISGGVAGQFIRLRTFSEVLSAEYI